MSLPARSISVTALFAVLASVALADSFTYTTIDDPLGVLGTQANGINNLGQIVGTYIDASGIQHGFLDSGGIFTTIDDPSGSGTTPNGINDYGQIVGSYSSSASTGLVGGVGFLDSGGTFTTIVEYSYPCYGQFSPIECSTGLSVYGINDAGQIVGSYTGYNLGGRVAFELTANGYTSYGPGEYGNVFSGINNSGEIAGYSIYPTDSGFLVLGFVDNNGLITFIEQGTGTANYVTGINDSGEVIGPGFLYNGGIFTAIDGPVGAASSYASGINDSGQIVGYYEDSSGIDHGFLATLTSSPEPSTLTMAFAAALLIAGFRSRKWRRRP